MPSSSSIIRCHHHCHRYQHHRRSISYFADAITPTSLMLPFLLMPLRQFIAGLPLIFYAIIYCCRQTFTLVYTFIAAIRH